MKDLIAGLWSALCIGVTLLWEGGVEWWGKASLNKRTAVVIIVSVVLSIAMVRCVSAAPNEDSGYAYVGGEQMAGACYIESGQPISGEVVPCLVGAKGPGTMIMIDGSTAWCAVTGASEDGVPIWSCAPSYEEALQKVRGI